MFEPLVETTARGAVVVVPHTERGYHPWCAEYSRVSAAFVSRRLAEHRLGMNRFLADVKTLAEYDELEALHGHHR